jgi:hypothetical protein
MYTAPVISLIKAYTPPSPLRATFAALRFLVLSKFVNSLTRGKGSVEEVESVEEAVEVEEVEDEEVVESVEERVVESLIELVFEESLAEVESVVDSLLNFANAKVTNTLY